MDETLGKRIVFHRKRLKLTQDQLAEKMGVTAQAISKWENDQTCPDIALLPRLAELFGITTDELLGHRTNQNVYQAEVIDNEQADHEDGIHVQKGNWEFHWDSGRRGSLWFAFWVLAFGVLYLLSQVLSWDVSFWDILWPTWLLAFGFGGILGPFSFVKISCILFGGYALVSKIWDFPIKLEKGVFWAALIVIFGLSLLVDALRKPKRGSVQFRNKNSKTCNDYNADDTSFTYHARFGETTIPVMVPNLQHGDIEVSFGEYTVDLTQAGAIQPECRICAACSFGELRLLIPKSCKLTPACSTSFAEFATKGSYNEHYTSEIFLDAHASFGEISAEYV